MAGADDRPPIVGVIGTINYDHVISEDREYEGIGGILYNILGLHYLSAGSIRIKPVVNYGYDIESLIENYINGKPNIDRHGFHRQEVKNPSVVLTDCGNQGKSEKLKYRVRQLSYRKLKHILDSDLLLVNFISGRDLQTETLVKLRANYHGIIYIDVHSFTLGIDRNGSRYYRRPVTWRETLKQADIIQMNLMETTTMLGKRGMDDDDVKPSVIDEMGREVLGYGPRLFIMSLGGSGARLFLRKGAEIETYYAERDKQSGIEGEATGCGDLLASAFIVSIINGLKLSEALDYAVKIAAEKFKRPGPEQLWTLERFSYRINRQPELSLDRLSI